MAKCILEIRDEVNVKFVGLDVKTRRKISEEVKYFLPYAYHMPAYKLGRWDGCVRYCDIGGRTYMNLLDRLIPIVQADGYEIEIDDQRDDWKFNFVYPNEFIDLFVMKGSIAIDGTSLTIGELNDDNFSVYIIPHTYQKTIFSSYKEGDKVNLEMDLLGKYVKRILSKGGGQIYQNKFDG